MACVKSDHEVTREVSCRIALLKKRHRRWVRHAVTTTCTLCIALIACIVRLSSQWHADDAHAIQASSLELAAGSSAGGYVLAGMVGFVLGTILTLLCVRARERPYKEMKGGNPVSHTQEKLVDVVKTYDAATLCKETSSSYDKTFSEIKWVSEASPQTVEHHVQGIAVYQDHPSFGSIAFTSHSAQGNLGYYMIHYLNEKACKKFSSAHTNHPGGLQRIGSFVVIPEENDDDAFVYAYDLSTLTSTGDTPQHPIRLSIHRSKQKTGYIGITNYFDGVGDYHLLVTGRNNPRKEAKCKGGTFLSFYQSPQEDGLRGQFIHQFDVDLDKNRGELGLHNGIDIQAVSLVTQQNGLRAADSVYLVVLSTEKAGSYKDYTTLLKVDVQTKVLKLVSSSRHLNTHAGGITGPHFRYGATANTRSRDGVDHMEIFVTERRCGKTLKTKYASSDYDK